MSFQSMYRRLEWKRALRILPQYLAGAVVLLGLMALLAVGGMAAKPKEETQAAAKIALVLNDNAELSLLGMQVLENAKSTQALCEFMETDEQTALEGIETGELQGAVIFPEQFVNQVVSSEKSTAYVYMPMFGNTFNDSVLKGLVNAAGYLLAGIETSFDGVAKLSLTAGLGSEDRYKLINGVSAMIAEHALSREDIFVTDTARGTGALGGVAYYACAALVLLLLLGGIGCGTLLKGDTRAYCNQLTHHGIGPYRQLLVKYSAVLLLFFVMDTILFGLVMLAYQVRPAEIGALFEVTGGTGLLLWYMWSLPIVFLAGAIVLFVFTFSYHQIGGILLLFLLTVLMGYCSGCLAPSAFLPASLREFGEKLPTAVMFGVLRDGIRGDFEWRGWLMLGVHSSFWLAGSFLTVWIKERQEQ